METYRRDYILPPDDTEYLNNTFPGWESIEGGWVLIPNYPLPAGFTVAHTTVAIQIPPAYVVSVRGSPARLVAPDANNVRQSYLAIRAGCRSERKTAAAFLLQISL